MSRDLNLDYKIHKLEQDLIQLQTVQPYIGSQARSFVSNEIIVNSRTTYIWNYYGEDENGNSIWQRDPISAIRGWFRFSGDKPLKTSFATLICRFFDASGYEIFNLKGVNDKYLVIQREDMCVTTDRHITDFYIYARYEYGYSAELPPFYATVAVDSNSVGTMSYISDVDEA